MDRRGQGMAQADVVLLILAAFVLGIVVTVIWRGEERAEPEEPGEPAAAARTGERHGPLREPSAPPAQGAATTSASPASPVASMASAEVRPRAGRPPVEGVPEPPRLDPAGEPDAAEPASARHGPEGLAVEGPTVASSGAVTALDGGARDDLPASGWSPGEASGSAAPVVHEAEQRDEPSDRSWSRTETAGDDAAPVDHGSHDASAGDEAAEPLVIGEVGGVIELGVGADGVDEPPDDAPVDDERGTPSATGREEAGEPPVPLALRPLVVDDDGDGERGRVGPRTAGGPGALHLVGGRGPATAVTGSDEVDDLTRLVGVDEDEAAALASAGIVRLVDVALAPQRTIERALVRAGLPIPVSVGTWGVQAGFLDRGDERAFARVAELVAGDGFVR